MSANSRSAVTPANVWVVVPCEAQPAKVAAKAISPKRFIGIPRVRTLIERCF
jgi:hypothetical protein